jgi:hypothetical protein
LDARLLIAATKAIALVPLTMLNIHELSPDTLEITDHA